MIIHSIADTLARTGETIDASRAQSDRAAEPCAHCGTKQRWCTDRATGQRILITVGPRWNAAPFVDPEDLPRGAVAVFDDGTCRLITAALRAHWDASWHLVRRSYIYQVHWEVCEGARADRDRFNDRQKTFRARVEDVPLPSRGTSWFDDHESAGFTDEFADDPEYVD